MEDATFEAVVIRTDGAERIISVPERSPRVDSASEGRSLAKCVHRAILRLTPGRVRELRVEVRQGTIHLHGRCGSFYCKQLAQHAAMDLADGEVVDNQIVVDG